MRIAALSLCLALAACAQTGPAPTAASPAGTSTGRHVPAKCTACHLAPAEHSLSADKWPRYLKAHKRRLHLSDQDQAFLYDFLVGGTPPPASP